MPTATERVTAKHLTAGDLIVAGPLFNPETSHRYNRPHPSEAGELCTVERVERRRTALTVYFTDGTHTSAGHATRFTRGVSA